MPGTAGFHARTELGIPATLQRSYKTARAARVFDGVDGKQVQVAPAVRELLAMVGFAVNFWAWALLSPLGPVYRASGRLGALSESDVALLVALAGKTPYDAVRSAAEALGPERLAGVVLNRVSDAELPESRYHDYYDAPRR